RPSGPGSRRLCGSNRPLSGRDSRAPPACLRRPSGGAKHDPVGGRVPLGQRGRKRFARAVCGSPLGAMTEQPGAMTSSNGLTFFDCNCALGPSRTRVFRFARTAGELIEEMDFANVGRALVYHTAMRFDPPAVGNELVLQETAGQPRLSPTWAV